MSQLADMVKFSAKTEDKRLLMMFCGVNNQNRSEEKINDACPSIL